MHAGRPWQKLAVDLVGSMPETSRGNKWILVLVDHFTRWQEALAIPDATAPVVATTMDMLMLGRELRLPDQLQYQPPPEESRPRNEFVVEIKDKLEQAHETLRQHQLRIRQGDQEESLLFATGVVTEPKETKRRESQAQTEVYRALSSGRGI